MAKPAAAKSSVAANVSPQQSTVRPSVLLDTRVVYCGDNLEQLAKLPDACVKVMLGQVFGNSFYG